MNPEILKPQGGAFKLSLGERGEMLAWGYLTRAGFKILEKNYRTKLGEIDVIAEKNRRLYFIEVKTRSNTDKGLPAESVTLMKQKKIARLASEYLQKNKKTGSAAALSVLAVLWQPPAPPVIEWFENAFSLPDGYFA